MNSLPSVISKRNRSEVRNLKTLPYKQNSHISSTKRSLNRFAHFEMTGDIDNLTLADKWILENLNNLIKEVTDDLDNYRFSQAGEKIKEFTWNDFADWYIEISKIEKNKDEILNYILKQLLILAHPFVPFVTEEIWKNLGTENLLIIEKWPHDRRDDDLSRLNLSHLHNQDAINRVSITFEIIKNIITAIRNARAEYKIEPSKKIDAVIYTGKQKEIIESQEHLIKNLRTGIDKLEIKEKGGKIKDAVYMVIGDIEIYLTGIIDKEKEIKNLEKEIAEIKKYLETIRTKLGNDDFIANAPAEIVEKEREKFMEGEKKSEKLEEKLKSLL